MEPEYEHTNVSLEEFFDYVEYMLATNPENNGVEIDDSKGRSWFIERTDDGKTYVN